MVAASLVALIALPQLPVMSSDIESSAWAAARSSPGSTDVLVDMFFAAPKITSCWGNSSDVLVGFVLTGTPGVGEGSGARAEGEDCGVAAEAQGVAEGE
ncbi:MULTISPECIES: hypothetical protein, partial [unclassified Streptomyces]|uniref:hypothetical protein n=1 Tax=unclassified Streptomyces TaxID=2593676 RepID=UPI001EEFAF6B